MSVFDEIVDLIAPGSTVLDLGCDDCTLLDRLIRERGVRGRGVDINDHSIQECMRKGISVFHGNLDEGLKDHPTGSYDYVVLSRTLQQVRHPHRLLTEMVRVGKTVIVNYPNFAHFLNRIQLGFGGRMPVNKHIPYEWYDTPNIHFFTHRDFRRLCLDLGITIEREIFLSRGRTLPRVFANLFATEVCCVVRA